MTSPVIDKIIELSIPNLINKDKEGANIDSAIREARNGYRDAFRYDRRLASEISLTKAISKSLNIDIDNNDNIYNTVMNTRSNPYLDGYFTNNIVNRRLGG